MYDEGEIKIGVASAVMQVLYQIVKVKGELGLNLSIYYSGNMFQISPTVLNPGQ